MWSKLSHKSLPVILIIYTILVRHASCTRYTPLFIPMCLLASNYTQRKETCKHTYIHTSLSLSPNCLSHYIYLFVFVSLY